MSLSLWNNSDVVKFFSKKRAILGSGIFLLDTTTITLPDNSNYEGAEYLSLDSDKNYVNVDKLRKREKSSNTLCATRW